MFELDVSFNGFFYTIREEMTAGGSSGTHYFVSNSENKGLGCFDSMHHALDYIKEKSEQHKIEVKAIRNWS